jgi:protein disulfide-isomerase A6
LNVLKDTAQPSEAFDFQFGWIHADQSREISNLLQLPEDYPSIFFVHPSKQLYRNYVGSWSEKNLQKWLNQVGSGHIQAWPYKGELKLNEKPQYTEEDEKVEKNEPEHDEL